jgi:hypothetical protein
MESVNSEQTDGRPRATNELSFTAATQHQQPAVDDNVMRYIAMTVGPLYGGAFQKRAPYGNKLRQRDSRFGGTPLAVVTGEAIVMTIA